MPTRDYDLAIVGGGILGLAIALSLAERFPSLRLVLLEKENHLAAHQTGHNSGVIHSGIYYKPGSLKASLCLRGARAMEEFCGQHGIPLRQCGKVILALTQEEVPRLKELHQRGLANGLSNLSLIGPERLREIEPEAAGLQALHLPDVSITDYSRVAETLAGILQHRGVEILTRTRVLGVSGSSPLRIRTTGPDLASRFLLNCAGLHADRIAASARETVPLQIIPFRGEYFELAPQKRSLVKGLIYPVPDPRLPFLGVHLSSRVDGRVEAGPNAVLALKREGYRQSDASLRDIGEMLRFKGFRRMAAWHWRTGLEEAYRSMVKGAFVRSVQRLVPAVHSQDLVPAGSGVRAQAVGLEGNLLDDFHLVWRGRTLHVCNAPSPAATASLAIGEYITDLAAQRFNL